MKPKNGLAAVEKCEKTKKNIIHTNHTIYIYLDIIISIWTETAAAAVSRDFREANSSSRHHLRIHIQAAHPVLPPIGRV